AQDLLDLPDHDAGADRPSLVEAHVLVGPVAPGSAEDPDLVPAGAQDEPGLLGDEALRADSVAGRLADAHFNGEYAVGCQIWLWTGWVSGPFASVSARPSIHSGSPKNALSTCSRSAMLSQASR